MKSLWGAVAGALGKKKSHANMIKQRYEDMLRASVEQDEQDEEEAQDYEVDQILDKRTHQGQLEYLVKWKGADANEDDTSWEPRRNLAGCDEALHEFERSSRAPVKCLKLRYQGQGEKRKQATESSAKKAVQGERSEPGVTPRRHATVLCSTGNRTPGSLGVVLRWSVSN